MRRKVLFSVLMMGLTLLYFGDVAMAQEGQKTRSLFDQFVVMGGVIGWLLIVMDVVSWGFIVEEFITIRRATILPPQVLEQLRAMLEQKQYREMLEFAANEPSAISHVVHAALSEAAHGYGAMERAMEEANEERTSKLLRKIEVLNVFGNVGPMLGLLGTVYGMILAFNEIVRAGGIPEPAKLADSIGIALVTTFWGLVVAIPALCAYGLMRNRIDSLSAETALVAQEMISTFRPSAAKAKAQATA